MADYAYDVLRYMRAKHGPTKPISVALQEEGRGIPRQAKVDLTARFGRNTPLDAALQTYERELAKV